ncbi:MAG: helix-turn-helix domain-containing protein [Planctomycetes bacterium]|nr:helix-turn-helix domain-containing protein [Planctomycetota bacterium]
MLPPTRPLAWLPPPVADAIARGFAGLSRRRFSADAATASAFATLVSEGIQRRLHGDVVARAALLQLLVSSLRAQVQGAAAEAERSPEVVAAMALQRDRLGKPISVAQLARQVGLSRSRLHQRFVDEIGMSPNEHVTALRIEHAQQLLGEGASAAEIAAAIGLSSPRHLSVLVKRATGLTLSAWRASAAKP